MAYSIFSSILYLLCEALLISGFLRIKKTNKTQSVVISVFITIVGVMCLHTLTSGLLTLLHIPVVLISMALVDGVLGGLIWWRALKTKSFEKYTLNPADVVVVCVIAAVVFVFWGKMYGTSMTPAFYVTDGSAHYMEAMRVIRDRNVTDMYYHSINNALLIMLFTPIISAPHFYKAYLFGELVNLFLSGLSLYCLMRHYAKDRVLKIIAVGFTLIYLVGYPLNNSLFGFIYLGEGITVIAMMILVFEMYSQGELEEKWGIILGCLSATGIALSYMLFAAVAFIAGFLRINLARLKDKNLFTAKTVLINLGIFLIPCVLTLIFAYGGIFGSTDETVGGAIAAEGTIYRDLFSNFLPWMPFSLYGCYALFRQKKSKTLLWFTGLFFLQTIAFFMMAYLGMISTYYFYKMHYLMWLFTFATAFAGIALLPHVARPLPICSLAVWALVFIMFITNLDGRIQQKNPFLAEPKAAAFFNNLFNYNLIMVAADPGDDLYTHMNKNKLDLLDSAYYYFDEHPEIDMETFMPVTSWTDSYWVVSVLDLEKYYKEWWPSPTGYVDEEYGEKMEEADYLLVFTDSDGFAAYQDLILDGYEVLYSNDLGLFLKAEK